MFRYAHLVWRYCPKKVHISSTSHVKMGWRMCKREKQLKLAVLLFYNWYCIYFFKTYDSQLGHPCFRVKRQGTTVLRHLFLNFFKHKDPLLKKSNLWGPTRRNVINLEMMSWPEVTSSNRKTFKTCHTTKSNSSKGCKPIHTNQGVSLTDHHD